MEMRIPDPANAVQSIIGEISFGANGEMIVDIQSAGGGSGWWRFIYIDTNVYPQFHSPPTTYTVTFNVHTDLIVGNVSADGIYIGGGFVGGNDVDC